MSEDNAKNILRDSMAGAGGPKSIEVDSAEDTKEFVPESKPKSKIIMPTSAPPIIDIPELSLEDFEIPIVDEEQILDETNGSLKFGILGSGQGGGRVAKAFFDIGYKKCIAVNTANHDLELLALPENRKLVMDVGSAGAGKDMSKGKEAAMRYKQELFEKMRAIFGNDIDYLMVCIGGGGGSGSGSALTLLEIAKQYMGFIGAENPSKQVSCVLTLPTKGESTSPLVAQNAYNVLQSIGQHAKNGGISHLVVVDNSKIERQYRGLTIKQFWPTINNTVSGLFDIFNRLSNHPSPYASFDPTDYKSVLQAGGLCVMGVTKVTSFDSDTEVAKAMKQNIEKTLLCDVDLSTATMAAAIAVGGAELIQNTAGLMDSLNYGFDMLGSLCPKATVHRGIYEDDKPSLRIYTIVGGLDLPRRRMQTLKGEEIYP